jgi:hypothetical protein
MDFLSNKILVKSYSIETVRERERSMLSGLFFLKPFQGVTASRRRGPDNAIRFHEGILLSA